MRFWDTSALLPLFMAEKESRRVRSWLRRDPVVVVWTSSRVELLSTLASSSGRPSAPDPAG